MSATVPDWISAAAAGVTALSVLVAGGFAYLRYLRGRVLHADLSIEISAQLILVAGETAVLSRLRFRNSGTLLLRVGGALKMSMSVYEVTATRWRASVEAGATQWNDGFVVAVNPMLDQALSYSAYELEPGADFAQSVLVPLGGDRALAYKVNVSAECAYPRLLRRSQETFSSAANVIVAGASLTEGVPDAG